MAIATMNPATGETVKTGPEPAGSPRRVKRVPALGEMGALRGTGVRYERPRRHASYAVTRSATRPA